MVCIPVKSVTVADPPKMSIDDTIMFVASLVAQQAFSFSMMLTRLCSRTRKT